MKLLFRIFYMPVLVLFIGFSIDALSKYTGMDFAQLFFILCFLIMSSIVGFIISGDSLKNKQTDEGENGNSIT